MAVKPILVYPNDALTRPATDVTEMDDDLRALIQDMIDTMHAEPGVGLAANQIGDPRNVLVIDLSAGEEPGQVKIFINPRIVDEGGRQSGEEGCLSFPGLSEIVVRPNRVRLEALNESMEPVVEEPEGFYARAICHEVDHLSGLTFLKRMSPLKRGLAQRKIQRLIKQGEWPEAVMPDGSGA